MNQSTTDSVNQLANHDDLQEFPTQQQPLLHVSGELINGDESCMHIPECELQSSLENLM